MVTWSKGYPPATGRDFADVMAELGLDDTATLERLAPAGAIYFLMSPNDVQRIIRHPLTMVGSDGLPIDPHPHPRQWGTCNNVQLGSASRREHVCKSVYISAVGVSVKKKETIVSESN